MRLGDVAALVSGRLEHGDAECEISGVQTLDAADASQVSFLANPRYKHLVEQSKASAILLAEDTLPDITRTVIRVKDPYLSFALLQRHFHPPVKASGVRAESAVIDPSARLASDVDVDALAVIGRSVRVGAGSRIGAGCVVEDNAVIGEGCTLYARSVVASSCILGRRVVLQPGAIIGSDGFGYAWSGREHLRIPQTGRVVLGDDVEVGANTCIDRGAIGDTVIGNGVKLDNLVQIGHNVRIGDLSIIVSQTGISGSTVVGAGCQFGGQVGIAGHLNIGDGCRIAAKSGVLGDLEAGGTYAGIPVMPHRTWLKVSALIARLPELWKKLERLTRSHT